MKIKEFPFCCTGKLFMHFGESDVAEGYYDAPLLTIKQYIKKIKEYINDNSNLAFICCTTNSEQKTINKALRKLNFSHSKWFKKKQHNNTKVRIWYKELNV
jgi:hypothetical protein